MLETFRSSSVDDLYADLGQGLHTGREVMGTVFPGTKAKVKAEAKGGKVLPSRRARTKKDKDKDKDKEHAIPIRGLIPGMAVHFAGCCHALPGDRIVGIVTAGKGVTVHTIDCEALESFTDTPERWLDLAWDVDSTGQEGHVGRITVVVANERGSLGSLSTVIGKNDGNITNLKITNRSADFFEMTIDIEVQNVRHLTNIVAALRATPAINSVERARG